MSEQVGAQTERPGDDLPKQEYGHLSVEDEPEGAEARPGPGDAASEREVAPSGPSGDLSTHDYGHLTVEDDPAGTVDPGEVADTAGPGDDT